MNEVYEQHNQAFEGVGGVSLFSLSANSKEHFLDDEIHPLFKVTTPIPITSGSLLKPPNLFQNIYLSKQLCPPVRKGPEGVYVDLHNDVI